MDFLAKTIGGTISSLKGIGVPYTTADRINDPTDPDFPSIWSIHDSTAKVITRDQLYAQKRLLNTKY